MFAINWMVDHWEYVCAGAVVLVSLLNVVTRHYSQSSGVARLALLAIDLLSLLTSAAKKPVVKLPLTLTKAPPVQDLFETYQESIRRRVQEIKQCREKQQP